VCPVADFSKLQLAIDSPIADASLTSVVTQYKRGVQAAQFFLALAPPPYRFVSLPLVARETGT